MSIPFYPPKDDKNHHRGITLRQLQERIFEAGQKLGKTPQQMLDCEIRCIELSCGASEKEDVEVYVSQCPSGPDGLTVMT